MDGEVFLNGGHIVKDERGIKGARVADYTCDDDKKIGEEMVGKLCDGWIFCYVLVIFHWVSGVFHPMVVPS